MENNIQIFEGKKIRSVWDNEKEEWYFSVVDVVGALTDSVNARDYWYKMKKRMTDEEKSELSTICRQLKLKAPDGKMRLTDVADYKEFSVLFNQFRNLLLSINDEIFKGRF